MEVEKKPHDLDKEYILTNPVTFHSYLSKVCYKHYCTQEKY